MPLTDIAVRSAKPGEKLAKLSDGAGLQLWIYPDGAKRWRLAYRFGNKQKVLALGVYPRLGLKQAREMREEAKKLLAAGSDPSAVRQVDRTDDSEVHVPTEGLFCTIAAELVEKKRREERSPATLEKTAWLLKFAEPELGPKPIKDITGPDILNVLKGLEARGRLESARRLRSVIGEVFRYAVATNRAAHDPTVALRGAISAPKVTHRAAITDPADFGRLLRAIDGYNGSPEVRIGLQLLALTFVRPGELRFSKWLEFDLQKCVWTVPAERMKMRRSHKVPLAPQAIELLHQLRLLNNYSDLLFPSARDARRPLSENTFNAAIRRLDFRKEEMSAHGFRAAASSILNESGQWNPDAIEAQLAHVEGNSVRRAYARAEYWDERVKMMNWWADRLDAMRRGGEVVSLRA